MSETEIPKNLQDYKAIVEELVSVRNELYEQIKANKALVKERDEGTRIIGEMESRIAAKSMLIKALDDELRRLKTNGQHSL